MYFLSECHIKVHQDRWVWMRYFHKSYFYSEIVLSLHRRFPISFFDIIFDFDSNRKGIFIKHQIRDNEKTHKNKTKKFHYIGDKWRDTIVGPKFCSIWPYRQQINLVSPEVRKNIINYILYYKNIWYTSLL